MRVRVVDGLLDQFWLFEDARQQRRPAERTEAMTRVAPCVYGFIICEREVMLRSLLYLFISTCVYIYENYIPGGRCL